MPSGSRKGDRATIPYRLYNNDLLIKSGSIGIHGTFGSIDFIYGKGSGSFEIRDIPNLEPGTVELVFENQEILINPDFATAYTLFNNENNYYSCNLNRVCSSNLETKKVKEVSSTLETISGSTSPIFL